MKYLHGKITEAIISDEEVMLVGSFKAILVTGGNVTVIGQGRLDALFCEECIVISQGGPIAIGTLMAGTAIITGWRHPVFIKTLRVTREGFLYRSIVGTCRARDLYISAMVSIGTLNASGEIVFFDPHSYVSRFEGDFNNVKISY